jgi:hypothetical protein
MIRIIAFTLHFRLCQTAYDWNPEPSNWLTNLDKTEWLYHIKLLLWGSVFFFFFFDLFHRFLMNGIIYWAVRCCEGRADYRQRKHFCSGSLLGRLGPDDTDLLTRPSTAVHLAHVM